MNQQDLKAAARGQGALASEIATRASDPLFYSALDVLPNPDTVLRKLGKSQEVFDAIHGDAHVLGELRSIRAALLGYEWRLQAGGDAPADIQAHELCQALMARRPAPGMQWADVIWSMAMSVFKGFAVHEVIWERQDNYLMPALLADRPQRRFVFGTDNRLRLITRSEMMRGVELGEFKWLLTRHMPAYENPYGVAVYSACFWPYTFKHGGWKFFIKF
jgi:phage gp29-like protein